MYLKKRWKRIHLFLIRLATLSITLRNKYSTKFSFSTYKALTAYVERQNFTHIQHFLNNGNVKYFWVKNVYFQCYWEFYTFFTDSNTITIRMIYCDRNFLHRSKIVCRQAKIFNNTQNVNFIAVKGA